MKKLFIIATLITISSLAGAWTRRGPDVAFETRPIGVGPVTTETYVTGTVPVSQPVVVREPRVIETTYSRYPITYRGEYRPVSGAVEGAARAAEGVVEGAAHAVDSVIP